MLCRYNKSSYFKTRKELDTRTAKLEKVKGKFSLWWVHASALTRFIPRDSRRLHTFLAAEPNLIFFVLLLSSRLLICFCAAAALPAAKVEELRRALVDVRGKRDEITEDHDRLRRELEAEQAASERCRTRRRRRRRCSRH